MYRARLSYSPRPSSTALTMVEKLSSVRIITAASWVTSVPVPIAIPMSAFFTAGASLTPSPVHRDDLAFLPEDVDQADLVLGADPGDHADAVDLGQCLLLAHGAELGAGEHGAVDADSWPATAAAVTA